MEPDTLFDKGLKKIQGYRNWKSKLSVLTGIDADDIDRAIEQYDEKVIHAVLKESGMRKQPAIVFETNAKRLVSIFLANATWDRRFYIIQGPPGCGKTFVTTAALSQIESMPTCYVRANEFTKSSPSSLLRDIGIGFGVLKTVYANGYNGYAASTGFGKLVMKFKEMRGLLVIDESYKLNQKNMEFVKDLRDETILSIVLVGANMDEKISRDNLGPSLYAQIRRRITDTYILPPINDKDVMLILAHYRIKVSANDARIIASTLGRLGDVGTLMAALEKFARKRIKGKWADVGASDIMESIDEVMSTITMSLEEGAGNATDN